MFRPQKQLTNVIQTEERLPSRNGVYEGMIASDKICKYYITDETYFQGYEGVYWETRLEKLDVVVKIPTKEELAAIDAVKKAEESLKAAKKSLELIKENK